MKLALSLQMTVCLCMGVFKFFFVLFFDMPFFIKDFLSGPFSVFTEFVTILLLFYVLDFFAKRHMVSYLPNQGLNSHCLHWGAKS